jgi:hypothetical protein
MNDSLGSAQTMCLDSDRFAQRYSATLESKVIMLSAHNVDDWTT